MNEQVELLVNQGLETALSYVQATSAFVAEQAPLLVQEVLRFGLAYNATFGILWFFLTLAFSFASYKLYKIGLASGEEGPCVVAFFALVASICTFIGIIIQLLVVLKIVFAPRMYLIEQLRTLL